MKNYNSILSISGMFRSGTTLLARMLHSHSKIIVASDTMAEFFKSIRNEQYIENGININPTFPFDSNFNDNNSSLRNIIENSDFDIPIKCINPQELIQKIKVASEPFSPIFTSNLNEVFISDKNYLDLFTRLLDTIEKSYYKQEAEVLGFKTVWTEEFQSVFLNTFSNGKVLFIIRDPRSTIASSFAIHNHRYPLEFLIRQWRKSVFYALMFTEISQKFKDKCILIKYEELIQNPHLSITKILNFLDLKLEKSLLEPSNFRDGKNEKWVQNTSYDSPKEKFNTTNMEKWKQILPINIIKFIEYSCYPEMLKLNYLPEYTKLSDIEQAPIYPLDDVSQIAEWIKKFYSIEEIIKPKWQNSINQQEFKRNQIYLSKNRTKFSNNDIKNFFINEDYYDYIT